MTAQIKYIRHSISINILDVIIIDTGHRWWKLDCTNNLLSLIFRIICYAGLTASD